MNISITWTMIKYVWHLVNVVFSLCLYLNYVEMASRSVEFAKIRCLFSNVVNDFPRLYKFWYQCLDRWKNAHDIWTFRIYFLLNIIRIIRFRFPEMLHIYIREAPHHSIHLSNDCIDVMKWKTISYRWINNIPECKGDSKVKKEKFNSSNSMQKILNIQPITKNNIK